MSNQTEEDAMIIPPEYMCKECGELPWLNSDDRLCYGCLRSMVERLEAKLAKAREALDAHKMALHIAIHDATHMPAMPRESNTRELAAEWRKLWKDGEE